MFEFALLRRTGNNVDLIDVGLLAETLLFYERVHILLEGGTLAYLVKALGPDLLLDVLDRNGVSASFVREGAVVITQNLSHDFARCTPSPPPSGGRKPRRVSNDEWIATTIKRALGGNAPPKRLMNKLLSKLASGDGMLPKLGAQDLPAVMRADMREISSIDAAVKRTLSALLPSFRVPNDWYFRPIDVGGNFAIDTNFDFARLNQEYHKIIPPSHSSLTSAELLGHLFYARCTLMMGFKYLGELVIDPVTAAIIRLRTLELMRKRDAHINELDLFQEMHLPEGRKIRECLNSGERTFAEFLKLLDNANRFRHWLGRQNPDASLAREYFKSATAESWVDRLPTKSCRWSITTGLGLAVEALYPTGLAIASSQGVSLLDATLLDRVLKGWRPNHFVEGKMTEFIRGDSQGQAA